MKYNPCLIGLRVWRDFHRLIPKRLKRISGPLEVLYEIQEWFKSITGMGVTTQPVAGAQGELVGLKLFQAYHQSRGEDHRNIVLIPSLPTEQILLLLQQQDMVRV